MAQQQPKKTVIATIEFGIRDMKKIHALLDVFARATEKYGECKCFELWKIEVDGEEHDPDSPEETLW